MTGPVAVLSGLLAGTLHVLAGPDHLAAVAPLALRERARAWRAGALWGAGHLAGMLALGFLARAARDALPVEAISRHSERLVGVALIGIGLWGVRQALRANLHLHEHDHDGVRHAHLHLHRRAHSPEAPHAHRHLSFGIGLLHGLAGSSHLLGVLPSLAFSRAQDAALYLLSYGAASVISMSAFTALVGGLAARGGRAAAAWRRLMTAASAAAIVVGLVWLFAPRSP